MVPSPARTSPEAGHGAQVVIGASGGTPGRVAQPLADRGSPDAGTGRRVRTWAEPEPVR
jgi:hypothetical protein